MPYEAPFINEQDLHRSSVSVPWKWATCVKHGTMLLTARVDPVDINYTDCALAKLDLLILKKVGSVEGQIPIAG